VSQALERIRRVAKERKKEKFTSLLHHISIDLLDEAFFELKEEAAPGPHEASTAAPQKTDCCDTRSYSTGQGMRTNTGGPLQVPLADTREVGDKFDCRAGGRPPFWLVTTASGVRA
jgi:hypothetical protein